MHTEDLRIYLVAGEVPMMVGTVPSMSSRRIDISNAMLGSGLGLRLVCQSRLSRTTFSSVEFNASPSSRITWTVEGGLRSSSVAIY